MSFSSCNDLSTSVTFLCSGHRHYIKGFKVLSNHDMHHHFHPINQNHDVPSPIQRVHPKPNVPALTSLWPNTALQLSSRSRSRPPLLHHHPKVTLCNYFTVFSICKLVTLALKLLFYFTTTPYTISSKHSCCCCFWLWFMGLTSQMLSNSHNHNHSGTWVWLPSCHWTTTSTSTS